jgi:phenylalanyl-tRNA synthetase beta subunit
MVIPCIIALSTVDESGSRKSLIDQQNRLLQEIGTKLQTMEKKIKGLNALEVELAEQKERIELLRKRCLILINLSVLVSY